MICVIIYHKSSGSGRSRELAFRVRRVIDQLCCWDIRGPFETRSDRDAREHLVPRWAPAADLLVVLGGDGTLREVVSGLGENASRVRIGLIPTGNANVVARTLGIPLDSEGAISNILKGRSRSLDIGTVTFCTENKKETRIFLSMIEIGTGARVVERIHGMRSGRFRIMYKYFSDLMYACAGCAALFDRETTPFSINMENGVIHRNLTGAVISNGNVYAKSWSFSPHASMNDGIFDLYARDREDAISLLRSYCCSMRKKYQTYPFVKNGRGTHFSVVAACAPFSVQLDGDPVSRSVEMTIKVRPGFFKMICPL